MTHDRETKPADRAGDSAVARLVDSAVQSGAVVGAVVLVAQQRRLRQSVVAGLADREAGRSLQAETRFRIASMSKTIVAVAALVLHQRGLLSLEDDVTRWLPQFRPALPDGSRPRITLWHLLTHTAGLGYCFTEPAGGPFHSLGISDGLDRSTMTLAETVARVAKAPLLFAPGSAWRYSIASDVLGAVLAAASGADLPDLVRTLVTEPLGMAATGFHVDPDIVVATPYVASGGSTRRMQDPESLLFFESPIVYSPSRCFDAGAWPSGGTGMVSTAPDFLSLIDALCAGGAPLLPPATVAQLGRNAIGALDSGAGPGRGWGLAGAVVTDAAAAGLPGHAGSWGWGGVYGTHFFVDPAAALSVVCMTNTALTGMIGTFPDALRVAVYQDLADG